MKPLFTILILIFAVPAAAPLAAQSIFHSGDGAIDGRLCVGTSCDGTAADNLGQAVTLRLRQFQNSISVDDTTDPTSGNPSNDWDLMFNSAISEFFAVRDATSGAIPFVVEAGAGQNALYVASGDKVGFGTGIPQRALHVVSNFDTALRLQSTNIPFNPVVFDLLTNRDGFELVAANAGGLVPFAVDLFTPTDALRLKTSEMTVNDGAQGYDFRVRGIAGTTLFSDAGTGRLGVGTDVPEEVFHIRTDTPDTDAFALFDAAGTGSDAAFLLRQNGTVPTTWEFRNQQGSGRLNVGIAGGNTPFKIDDAANNNLLRLGLNGQNDVVSVTGRLLVNNTQLSVPDYVFGDDYALRPLSEVQAFIDANSHLPEVPSAADIAARGVDMTEMQMTLLKKVEELTLYALEQDARVAAQEAEVAQLRMQLSDMDSLRAQLARIEARLD